jgi:predicted transposase/invertase (TIGR01784 family)
MLAEKLKIYEKELILKGRQEGIQKGRQEGKLETALQMLKMSLDIDLIVQVTGLTKEQILELDKN